MDAYLPVLRRLGILLLVFFGLHLASVILDHVSGASHSYSLDLGSLLFGLLMVGGRLGAVPWLAFFTTADLVGVLATAPLALFAMPWARTMRPTGGALVTLLAGLLIEAAVSLWILRELRRPEITDALQAAKRRPVTRAMWWGCGASATAIGLAFALLLTFAPFFEGMNARAVAAARAQLGDGYQFQVTSFSSGSQGWRAHVVARRGAEVKQLDVGGPAP